MSQLKCAKKRKLPFTTMGITVPIAVTHSYPLPKVKRFHVRLASQIEAKHENRPVLVDGFPGKTNNI